MKMTNQVVVLGMKRSKGDFEGNSYDTTKFYIEADLDASKGNACGKAATEYSFGTSAEYDKFPNTSEALPYTAEADFEIVTSGKVTKIQLVGLRPKQRSKAAA